MVGRFKERPEETKGAWPARVTLCYLDRGQARRVEKKRAGRAAGRQSDDRGAEEEGRRNGEKKQETKEGESGRGRDSLVKHGGNIGLDDEEAESDE